MIPKLNDKPQYEMTIPSLNQTVRFRPYLVKEEKILMMAFESNDKVASLRAVTDTINACIDDEFKSNELKLFDIEYMFTKIRSKSVGEKVNLMITCSECEHKNEISVNIEDAKVDMPEKIDPNIEIAENVTVEMTWPIYTKMIQNNKIIDKPNEVDSMLKDYIQTQEKYKESLNQNNGKNNYISLIYNNTSEAEGFQLKEFCVASSYPPKGRPQKIVILFTKFPPE